MHRIVPENKSRYAVLNYALVILPAVVLGIITMIAGEVSPIHLGIAGRGLFCIFHAVPHGIHPLFSYG